MFLPSRAANALIALSATDHDIGADAAMVAVRMHVHEKVLKGLTQGELDALVSFVSNVGGRNFRTSVLLRHLNAGNKDGAWAELLHWIKPGWPEEFAASRPADYDAARHQPLIAKRRQAEHLMATGAVHESMRNWRGKRRA